MVAEMGLGNGGAVGTPSDPPSQAAANNSPRPGGHGVRTLASDFLRFPPNFVRGMLYSPVCFPVSSNAANRPGNPACDASEPTAP